MASTHRPRHRSSTVSALPPQPRSGLPPDPVTPERRARRYAGQSCETPRLRVGGEFPSWGVRFAGPTAFDVYNDNRNSWGTVLRSPALVMYKKIKTDSTTFLATRRIPVDRRAGPASCASALPPNCRVSGRTVLPATSCARSRRFRSTRCGSPITQFGFPIVLSAWPRWPVWTSPKSQVRQTLTHHPLSVINGS